MAAGTGVSVTGIVLKHRPVGEYDYTVTLFTREWGKLSAFARGARRVGTRLCGTTEPFCFGEFVVVEGRSANTLRDARIQNYFEGFREDYEGALYGSYLLELTDYYGREGSVDTELLRLLYQSLRALLAPALDRRLVRSLFELRLFAIEGEFAGIEGAGHEADASEALRYTVRHALTMPIERLYTCAVTPELQDELTAFCARLRRRLIDRPMKSLELLERI